MNNYELTVVLDAGLTAAKRKTTKEKLEKLIEAQEGKITKKEELGDIDLAYPIKKSEKGAFSLYLLSMSGEAAKRLSDKLRVEESILRYLLIKGANEA